MTRLCLLVFALLSGCAPHATMRTRGLSEPVSTDAVLREALDPRRVALVIGNDLYTDPAFPDLRHAVDDAQAIADVLRQPDAGFDDVVLLASDTGVTRMQILDAMRRLSGMVHRDDEMVVYFAGHGTRLPVEGVPHRFLLPSDASPTNLVATAIDLEALLSFVLALPPLRKGVIVDACFDGGGRSVARPGASAAEQDGQAARDVRVAQLGPGDVEVFSTTPGRPSLEDDSLRHGVYTWYLLQALSWGFHDADRDGDGVLTLWEAHDRARGEVIAHTNGAQVPEAILRTVGEADIVLRGKPDARRAHDAALLYLYPSSDSAFAGASVFIDGRARGVLPGTVPVEPGRHALTVVDVRGHTVADGYVEVDGGRAYRVDQLTSRIERDRGGVDVRSLVVAAPGLEPAMGTAALGLEIAVDVRPAPLKVRPLVLGARFALASGIGGQGTVGARPMVAGGLDLGAQGDADWLRWRTTWGLTGWWLPPQTSDRLAEPLSAPALAGWRFVSTGPRVSLGAQVGEAWTVELMGGAEGTLLQLVPDEPARFVPVVVGGLGVRAAF